VLVLNQPMYSTTASSSCWRVRHTRSLMSSVLKLSTKLSARPYGGRSGPALAVDRSAPRAEMCGD